MQACMSTLWMRKLSFRELRYSDSPGSLGSGVAEMELQLFLATKPMILTALLPWDQVELGARGINGRRFWPTPVP